MTDFWEVAGAIIMTYIASIFWRLTDASLSNGHEIQRKTGAQPLASFIVQFGFFALSVLFSTIAFAIWRKLI